MTAGFPGSGIPPTDLVFDMDGVIWVGDREIEGAGEVLQAATGAGINVLFVTNNASRTRGDLTERVAAITGYRAGPLSVLSSAMAGAALLEPDHRSCLVAGGPGVEEAVAERGVALTDDWHEADAVIAGFSRTIAYPRLKDAALAIRRGARFIATNTDATFPAPDGQWPGAGATVAFLREATGVDPVVGGKPHPPMIDLVRTRLAGDRVVMVGDRPETDLALARRAGWTAVLTLSGVIEDPAQVPAEHAPDLVVTTIAELPELFEF